MEEDGLADAFRTGSAEGFRAVYERYSGAVYTIALRILGDRELAADAVQVTFLNAWRACGTLEPGRPAGAVAVHDRPARRDRPVAKG
jgi:RNA polymerase sigma-70 factor (ECF subfamily)